MLTENTDNAEFIFVYSKTFVYLVFFAALCATKHIAFVAYVVSLRENGVALCNYIAFVGLVFFAALCATKHVAIVA
jgi:hypothetical protein